VPLFLVPVSAVILYGVISLVASRLVYQPSRYPDDWWNTQAELGARDVWRRARDGVRLHAWWVEAPGSRLATLYLHGNADNISRRPGHLREMVAAGSSVLILDYRGFGRSQGRPTERGLYRDADAACDYLACQGYPPGRIVLHGESLGSAVAVDLAARRPCAGLILECPITSVSDMAARTVPVFGPLFVSGSNARRKIGRVRPWAAPCSPTPASRSRSGRSRAPGTRPSWKWPARAIAPACGLSTKASDSRPLDKAAPVQEPGALP
jgi:alpha-beta hydrolase superfamily lysophospholipase